MGHVLRLSDLDAEFFCLGCGVGYRLSSERCSCGAGPTTSRIELETGLARSIGGTPPAPPAPTLGATPTTYGPEDVKAIRDSLSEAGVPFIVADASGMLLEPDASPADVVYAPSDVLDSLVRRYHPGEPVLVVDATMDPESSVLLAEYGSPGEAQVAVGLLESAGIPYEFERFTAQFGLLEGDLARTHIYVRRSDLDRARDVISPRASDSFEIGWSSDDERAMRAARLQRRFRIARVLMVMLATYDLVFAGFTLSGAPMNAVVPAVWGIALIALAAWSHREPRVSFLLGFLVVAASAIWSMVIRDTLFVLPGLLPLLATYFAFEAATKLRAEERT